MTSSPSSRQGREPASKSHSKLTVWINHGPEIMAEVVPALWLGDVDAKNDEKVLHRIIVTHQDPYFRGFEYATYSEIESAFDSAADYVDWAIGFAVKHQVDCIFPGLFADEIIAREAAFKALGITLLYSCSQKELALLDDRPSMYRRLEECFHGDIVPDWYIWSESVSASLESTVERAKLSLSDLEPEQRSVCVIPAQGKLKKGFYRFADELDPRQQLERPEERVIKVSDFSRMAARAGAIHGSMKKWIVMGYMTGASFSVDCLAWRGNIVAHVIREKLPGETSGHLIADNQFLLRQASIIARDFGISGIFNAKFRVDSRGRMKLLSANPRFFGGLGMSILAGVNLPWLWLKIHAGQGNLSFEVPTATVGLRVDSVLTSIKLPEMARQMNAAS